MANLAWASRFADRLLSYGSALQSRNCASARDRGLLVGRIDHRRLDFRVGYFRLRPRAKVIYFVHGGQRGNISLENSKLLVDEICQSLARREAEVAYLNFLRPDSPIYMWARKMPGFVSRDYICTEQPHFAMAIPRSRQEFYRGLSSKVRKNQRWQAKKLVSDFRGAVKICCFRAVTELDDLIRDVDQIARKSYQRGLGVGFVDAPEIRERLQLEAQQGWLRAYVLYIKDRPCAFWIGDVHQGTFWSDYMGYDPELAKYSPGMYLIMNVIEGFCNGGEYGLTEVDFAPGHAQYKEVLSNRQWTETSVYIFAQSVKGIELNLFRFFTNGIDKAVKKTLGQTRLFRSIKKAWRSHAAQKRRNDDRQQ